MNKQTKSRIRSINTEKKLMVARGKDAEELGKMSEGEWKIQISTYGINKSWE